MLTRCLGASKTMMPVHQARNQQIAKRIDREVTKLLSNGANDLEIFTGMSHQMGDFKVLMDTALPGEIDTLCARTRVSIDMQRFWKKSLRV